MGQRALLTYSVYVFYNRTNLPKNLAVTCSNWSRYWRIPSSSSSSSCFCRPSVSSSSASRGTKGCTSPSPTLALSSHLATYFFKRKMKMIWNFLALLISYPYKCSILIKNFQYTVNSQGWNISLRTFVLTATHQRPAFWHHEKPNYLFTRPSLPPVPREILARAGIEVLPEINVKTYPNT